MPYLPHQPHGLFGRRLNLGAIPRIDWSNPLTQGLAFCWVTLGGLQIDLVNSVYGSYTATAPTVTPYGQATTFSGAVGAGFANSKALPTSNGLGSGDFTLVALANPTSAGTAFGTSIAYGDANVNAIRLWMNGDFNGATADAGAFSLSCYDGTNLGGANSSNTSLDGSYHVFAGTRRGTTHQVWRDGVDVTASAGTPLATVTGASAAVGSDAGPFNVNVAGFTIAFAVAVNRAWTQAEHVQFARDPFQFLIWPTDFVTSQLVGVTATTFLNPPSRAWNWNGQAGLLNLSLGTSSKSWVWNPQAAKLNLTLGTVSKAWNWATNTIAGLPFSLGVVSKAWNWVPHSATLVSTNLKITRWNIMRPVLWGIFRGEVERPRKGP